MKPVMIDKLNTVAFDIYLLNKHKKDKKYIEEKIQDMVDTWKLVEKDFEICWGKICELMDKWRKSPTKKTPEEEKIINTFFEDKHEMSGEELGLTSIFEKEENK